MNKVLCEHDGHLATVTGVAASIRAFRGALRQLIEGDEKGPMPHVELAEAA